MATKKLAARKLSKKVKQVASKAKATPRTETNESVVPETNEAGVIVAGISVGQLPPRPICATSITEAQHAVNALETVIDTDGVVVEDGVEFAPPNKIKAVERSKKFELKSEIKTMIAEFRDQVNYKLQSLSTRIENQLRPMVQTVADIAVAKAEFETQFANFEDRLSATLNLNDELEPIDIANMFEPVGSAMDDEMETYGTVMNQATSEDDMELLAEVTEAQQKANNAN